jgi:hypothetical protein
MVFQPPQSGQRPTHRGDWWPHDWQEKLTLAFKWKRLAQNVTKDFSASS